MPSQSELSGGQVLQKIYIRGENGTLLSIPETYVIVENNNEVVGQDPCQFGGDPDQNALDDGEATVVHIIEESEYKPTDEDLTSLNWLQDINVVNGLQDCIIKPAPTTVVVVRPGIPLQAKGVPSIRNSVAEHRRIASTPSNRGDQVSEPCSETESSCDGSNLSYTEISLPVDVNYGNQNEGVGSKVVFTKPPHSFSTLIFLAIESSPIKAMPVRDIYAWITQHFPYYRYAPAGWKNSVRHNLSLSKSFCKVQQYPGVGKGSLWKVDPHHRPQLIQSLRKIPDFSAEQLQQIIAGGAESSPVKTERHTNAEEAEPQDPLSSTPSSSSSSCSPYTHRSNMPDPTLFPYLSRRLGVSVSNDSSPAVCSQPRADVDAATAMLALRQEFVLSSNFPPKKCYSPRRTREHSYEQQPVDNDTFIHEVQEEVEVRSTTQPSPVEEDHTYSFCPRPSKQRPVHKIAGRKSETPIKSEPVGTDSDHITAGTSMVIKPEPIFYDEDNDTLESANALLGLAGIKREYVAISEPETQQPERRRAKNHPSGPKRAKSAPKRGRGRVRGK